METKHCSWCTLKINTISYLIIKKNYTRTHKKKSHVSSNNDKRLFIWYVAPVSTLNESEILGIIIITVVICAVITSVVWVLVIYKTRRQLNSTQDVITQPTTVILTSVPEVQTQLYLDTSSQHSKDSGTGDSTNPSNDQLQLCLPGK